MDQQGWYQFTKCCISWSMSVAYPVLPAVSTTVVLEFLHRLEAFPHNFPPVSRFSRFSHGKVDDPTKKLGYRLVRRPQSNEHETPHRTQSHDFHETIFWFRIYIFGILWGKKRTQGFSWSVWISLINLAFDAEGKATALHTIATKLRWVTSILQRLRGWLG